MSVTDQLTQLAAMKAILKPEPVLDLRETVKTINVETRSDAYIKQANALAELAKNIVVPEYDASNNVTNQAAVDASKATWNPILEIGHKLLAQLAN